MSDIQSSDIDMPSPAVLDIESDSQIFPVTSSKISQVYLNKTLPSRLSRADMIGKVKNNADTSNPRSSSGNKMSGILKKIEKTGATSSSNETPEHLENQSGNVDSQLSTQVSNTSSDSNELQRDFSLSQAKTWWKRVWASK